MVFTTRFAGGRHGRNARNGFETELARHRVIQKHSSPNHPQTCGKVCEDCAAVPHRRGSDPGQGMTTVSCVRYVDPGRCGALVRAGQTDLT